jgi:hypothetical protein
MAVAELEQDPLANVKEESYWGIIWMRFRKHKLAVGGMVVIIIIVLACLLAPWVAPYPPTQINTDENGAIYKNAPPSLQFPMGTDNIGRDVFSRLLYAGRISLTVAFVVTFFADDPVLGRFIQADTLVPEPGNPLAWDRYAYVLNNPVSFLDPSGHKPCDEILWNGQCIRFDKIIPPPELPKVPDAPSDGDLATPWDVGIEWLMGEGPRRHEFREGDPFTELLQEHDYLEYLKAITGEKLKAGDFSLGYYKYDLSGIEGILKYIKDYSTLITLGETGNLAVTYLGGYIVEVYITDVNFSTGDAEVTFHVWNSSTLGSGIRPPVIGYKGFWNNIVSPLINPSKGRMSKVEQSFWWSETISFKK